MTSFLSLIREQIDLLEHHADNLIEAIGHGGDTVTPDQVAYRILSGQATLFADADSFVITEIKEFPDAKYLNCWLMGGKMDAILRWEEELYALARNVGATHLIGAGRRGWERALRDHGYEFYTTTLRKEVPHVSVH